MAEGSVLIKFNAVCIDPCAPPGSERLAKLVEYCDRFSELGFSRSYADMLPEVREKAGYPSRGSEGNLSCRDGDSAFLVTGSQLESKRSLKPADFARIIKVETNGHAVKVSYQGSRPPSSESILHDAIYKSRPEAGAIFHGHGDDSIREFEKALKEHGDTIPEEIGYTRIVPEPGTTETSESTLAALDGKNFAVIRGHGFVAVGRSMDDTFEIYLKCMEALEAFLQL